jgi:putative DNA primase/helicase
MHMDSFDEELEDEVVPTKQTALNKLIFYLSTDEQLKGMFCFNMFTNEIEHAQDNHLLSHMAKKGTIVTDADASCIRVYISKKHGMLASKVNIDDAIIHVAFNKSYHPIKDYLESLKWDGQERLDFWLQDICGAEDNAYTRAVGRKMFVAAVKRIYEPGCYYAQLVILEGKQRIYKSRLVKEMGGNWYASIHLKTHDTKTVVEEMKGKWILEIEELAGFGKQDTEHMKAFVSRQHDRVRLSYARKANDYPRQSIMIATMNPDQGDNKYLVDSTGNVRYWPIACSDDKIQIDAFTDIRDQLFAEAMHLYQKGESLWLNTEEQEKLAEREQVNRMSEDPWVKVIEEWLAEKEKSLLDHKIYVEDIAMDCLEIAKEKLHSGITRRISRIMAECGWEKTRETKVDDKGIRRYYYCPGKPTEVDWDEEESN